MRNGIPELAKKFYVTASEMGMREKWKAFEKDWIESELSMLARFLYTVLFEVFKITSSEPDKR